MARQILGRLLFGLMILWMPGCGQPSGESGPAATARPHIVLISIDTLRADHLGAWGYERDTSPFMDGLAAAGTRFADAWAPSPWTLPSHATLLTGVDPLRHGATRAELSIARDVTMLQEALGIGGYSTCGVVTSMFVSARYGFARGFDRFHNFGQVGDVEPKRGGADAEEVFDFALAWAQEQSGPTFSFLHLFDVHYPYAPPEPFDAQFDRPSTEDEYAYRNYMYYRSNPVSPRAIEHQKAQYDEEIAYVDAALREFHDEWTRRWPNTVFVIVSDHGEEFGERGSWGHAHTLFPEQLHVPWIMHGPNVKPQVIDARVGLEDVASTLAALAGVELVGTDGVDRSEQLRSGSVPTADDVPARFASTYRHQTILHRWHEPPYDLHHDVNRDFVRLFDLKADPPGRKPMRAKPPEIVEPMREALYVSLGQPWELPRGGTVETTGVIVVAAQRRGQRAELTAGARFAVFPPDAPVTVVFEGRSDGPFVAVGGELPGEDSLLRWHGAIVDSESAELNEEQKARLRALGYAN